MEQKKLVTYKVAKALKEAGYPQGGTPYQYVTKNYDTFKEGEVIDSFYENWAGNNVIDIPTYLSTWLWLWNTKNIQIEVADKSYFAKAKVIGKVFVETNPEEAFAKAIEYLVTNNLIK